MLQNRDSAYKSLMKVINFLWRAFRSFLPLATALTDKRVQIDVKCAWCLGSNEDTLHVSFDCPFVTSMWLMQRIFDSCTRDGLY